jgi:hypothetical protein
LSDRDRDFMAVATRAQSAGLLGRRRLCLHGMSILRIGASLALLFGTLNQAATALDIISHPDMAATELTRSEAVLFFTRRLGNWVDGQQVKVFVLADDDPLHQAFAKKILGLFPYQLRRTWDRQLFSGTGQAPIQVANEAEMIRRVATTPGALGYAGSPPAGVRIQRMEGR